MDTYVKNLLNGWNMPELIKIFQGMRKKTLLNFPGILFLVPGFSKKLGMGFFYIILKICL